MGRIAAELKKTVDVGYRYRRYRDETVHEEGGGTQNTLSFEEWNSQNTRTVKTGVVVGVTVS